MVLTTIHGYRHGVGLITLAGIAPGGQFSGRHGIRTGVLTDPIMQCATGTASVTLQQSTLLIELLL